MKKLSEVINEKVDVKLQNLNSELLYLTEGGNQVGSLILIYNESGASIFSVEVLNSHRGKGYGKKLVENAISRCKEKRCQSENPTRHQRLITQGRQRPQRRETWKQHVQQQRPTGLIKLRLTAI